MSIRELKVGDSLGPLVFEPVSRLDLIKYAGASGDYNPIHTIDEEAAKAGLPGVIAHGMLTMGRMAKLFSPYLEEGFIARFSTRFTGMVFLNDTITFTAEVIESGDGEKTFSVVASNQKGNVVANASLVFRLFQ